MSLDAPAPFVPRLLADIGGTNARFAWQDGAGAPVGRVRTLACAAHATLEEALARYLADVGEPAPPLCAMAIANPIVGDAVRMTNHHWAFSAAALRERFGFQRLLLVNDFSALAQAIPALPESQLRRLPGGEPRAGAPIALIGPGTGLGVAGLLPDGHGGWTPVEGEGGHVTLAGCTRRERQVIERLAEDFGHVSAERAVSGQGLENLYRALRALDDPGHPSVRLAAADITARALAAQDAVCEEALALFCAFLGTVAGNLALTLGARGGLYVGGGVVPRLGRFLDASAFRERFDAKGRLSGYVTAIPVYVICAEQSPALLGAARALDADLRLRPVPAAGAGPR